MKTYNLKQSLRTLKDYNVGFNVGKTDIRHHRQRPIKMLPTENIEDKTAFFTGYLNSHGLTLKNGLKLTTLKDL